MMQGLDPRRYLSTTVTEFEERRFSTRVATTRQRTLQLQRRGTIRRPVPHLRVPSHLILEVVRTRR